MQEIQTKDGSLTYYIERYGECMHSKTGAIEESFKKFVEPCLGIKNPKLLDICFGLGYNSAAALENFGEDLEIVGLEADSAILQKIQNLNPNLKHYSIIKKLAMLQEFDNKKILIGNATQTIKTLPTSYFNMVFLDPFSPGKNPELWSADFFKEIYRVMKPCGVLTTYSCARTVRDNLKEVGFKVTDGPCVHRRGPSTIATKLLKKFDQNPILCSSSDSIK